MSIEPAFEAAGATILVVEDNTSARMALEALLEALGFRVLAVGDGDEAQSIFAAQAERIDLLISDLLLPRINGPDLYDLLKQQKPDLRCVLMSGYQLAEEGERLRAHGIEDPARAARMAENLIGRYEDAVTLTKPYQGVEAALQALQTAGHRLAVCTNKPLAPANAVLRHLGLAAYFDVVLGGDSGLPRKPDPAPLFETLRLMGAGPAAYVGDSEVDAATAEAAELPFFLFTEGYRHAPADSLPHRALFSDFTELPGLIRALG